MAQTVFLHGGPMHGETVQLPGNQNCLHILTPTGPAPTWTPGTPFPEMGAEVKTREGMYSRVRNTLNFEWDGWRSHDR